MLISKAVSIQSKDDVALDANAWGELYNTSLLETVVQSVYNEKVSVWTRELMQLTKMGNRVLEIGCGSGMSSLYLSKHGRMMTAIDYSKKSIALVNAAADALGLVVETECIDATVKLPFSDYQFDIAFQAGLLEHFQKKERVRLLKLWKPVCHRMISMIPNANSLAYRVGKALQEKNGTWVYGLEIPQSTLWDEFYEAGYKEIREYTIGVEHALNFLPQNHYLRIALRRWIDETGNEKDSYGQGYLLVTIGENN